MSKLSEAKLLGGIGSILLLAPPVTIVGFILVLIAVKYIADDIGNQSPFNDMIYAVVTGIVGVAIGVFGLVFSTLNVFLRFNSAGRPALFTLSPADFAGFFGFLVVIWIALVLSAYFTRRSLDAISARLDVPSFKTAGFLYFIGALLIIAFGFGVLIIFVAWNRTPPTKEIALNRSAGSMPVDSIWGQYALL